MHENILIIKSKKLDLRKTCEAVGDYLINKEHADYYTTPLEAAGQRIEGQIVMDLKKFERLFLDELYYSSNYLQSFFILSGDETFEDVQWDDEFIYTEFYALSHKSLEHLRIEAINSERTLMQAYLRVRLAELRESGDEYEVCYLDIHY